MKIFLVILISSVIILITCSEKVLVDDFLDQLIDLKSRCAFETNITEAIHLQTKTRDPNIPYKGKCYTACVMIRTGGFDDDNKIPLNRALRIVETFIGPQEFALRIFAKIFNDCNRHNITDKCDAAYGVYTCLFNHTNVQLLKQFI